MPTWKKVLIPVSLFIGLFFILFVINQTLQVVELADRLYTGLGTPVLWILLTLYAVLLIYPTVLILRMPGPLKPPRDTQSPEYEAYLQKLRKRLSRNPEIKHLKLDSRDELQTAIAYLQSQADAEIKKYAKTVFISTAISQSGRLDAFMVLSALVRMIWQVAKKFYQRPTMRDMIHLYANVAATTFIASELDDLDISHQVEPVVGSVLGASFTSAVPGVNLTATIITSSILTGAANAYLTLRVGAIAKRYCNLLVREERKSIRRSATVEAARLLSVIVMSSAGNVARAIGKAAVKKPGQASKDLIKNFMGKFRSKPEVPEEE
ncbi:MAG: hypothetical protein Kow0037_27570 [Calditrichia bacterium]